MHCIKLLFIGQPLPDFASAFYMHEIGFNITFRFTSHFFFQQCDEKHTAFRWCSQPVLNRNVLSGDLLISTAILASGNNYGKTALFARHLKMNYVSESSYNRFQTFYIVPAIQQVWTQNQAEVLDEMAGKDLVVLGMKLNVDCLMFWLAFKRLSVKLMSPIFKVNMTDCALTVICLVFGH